MLLPAIFYVAWDSWFTSMAVWAFNPEYITGHIIFNLPAEEVLFFFVVPYCCVFIYECMLCYFPVIKNTTNADIAVKLLAAILLITGAFFYKKYYTAYTFILLPLFIAGYYQFKKYFSGFNTAVFLISYAIILIPFLLVNGFLTALPVVIYNNAENLGIRIYSIPFEDVFYGMLLVFMNLIIYEKLKTKY